MNTPEGKDDAVAQSGLNAVLGENVVPIRPSVGMSRMEQLRAFVTWDKAENPGKTHIAEWALFEIESLRSELFRVQDISLRECGVGFVDVRFLSPNECVCKKPDGTPLMECNECPR